MRALLPALLCLLLTPSKAIWAKSTNSFDSPTLRAMVALNELNYIFENLGVSENQYEQIYRYGSHPPEMSKPQSKRDFTNYNIKIRSYKKMAESWQELESHFSQTPQCQRLHELVLANVEGHIRMAEENAEIEDLNLSLTDKAFCSVARHGNFGIAQQACDPFTKTRVERYSLSKARALFHHEFMKILHKSYVFGLDLPEVTYSLDTSKKGFEWNYQACTPQQPQKVLGQLHSLKLQSELVNKSLFGTIGRNNADNNLKILKNLSSSYKIGKNQTAVFGSAAWLIGSEIMILKVIGNMFTKLNKLDRLERMNLRRLLPWERFALNHSFLVGTSLGLGANYALLKSAELFQKLYGFYMSMLYDPEVFDTLLTFFAEDDLDSQDIDLIILLHEAHVNYEYLALDYKKNLYTRGQTSEKCEAQKLIIAQAEEILKGCPSCRWNHYIPTQCGKRD